MNIDGDDWAGGGGHGLEGSPENQMSDHEADASNHSQAQLFSLSSFVSQISHSQPSIYTHKQISKITKQPQSW